MSKKMFLALIIVIGLAFEIRAQTNLINFSPLSEIHRSWYSNKFGKIEACDTFFYTDKIYPYVLDTIKEHILNNQFYIKRAYINELTYNIQKDSIFISEDDKLNINKKIEIQKKEIWQAEMFQHSVVVRLEKVDELIQIANKKFDNIENKLCYTYHFFSKPVFFRNNSLCIFCFGEKDVLMLSGECWLYKKEKENWIKFSPIYKWFE